MWSALEVLVLHLGRKPAKSIHQLRPAAVVQRQRQRGAGVARRGLFDPAHLVLHFVRQIVRAPDVPHAHVVVHHALQIALQIGLQQAHQEADFGARPAQIVLERKCVERQPRQTDARSRLCDQLHAFGALLVAQEPLQRTPARPAPVAVHDDGHMLRQTLGLQRDINGALLRGQLIDALAVGDGDKDSPLDCICGFHAGAQGASQSGAGGVHSRKLTRGHSSREQISSCRIETCLRPDTDGVTPSNL